MEMKIHLMLLFIFLSVFRARVSVDKFSRVLFFHHFYPKIDSSTHFDSVFSNIVSLNRKTKNTVQFSIIKQNKIYNYAFTIKTDFRSMSESREFRQKK